MVVCRFLSKREKESKMLLRNIQLRRKSSVLCALGGDGFNSGGGALRKFQTIHRQQHGHLLGYQQSTSIGCCETRTLSSTAHKLINRKGLDDGNQIHQTSSAVMVSHLQNPYSHNRRPLLLEWNTTPLTLTSGMRSFSSTTPPPPTIDPTVQSSEEEVSNTATPEPKSETNQSTSSSSSTTDSSSSSNTPGETMEFQAETRQLLDIVINSLYTDKEVFVRELVSNASDALEKLRHLQATNSEELGIAGINEAAVPLEIRIELDEVTSSITITDTGVGMTRDEMIRNLGTIARSGSKNFVKEFGGKNISSSGSTSDIAKGIIGQFGVGFYSAFMVARKVEVRSKSALAKFEDVPPKLWTSDGVVGSYTINDLSPDIRQERGTSIVLYLKDEFWDFIDESKMTNILKKYSNFINFPFYLNGKLVNTQKAIWATDPKEVTKEEYVDFYRYYANAIDVPMDTYHFRADAPIDMKVLLYIPTFHSEKYGMGRMEPGISLYSRKVLIESKSKDILPDWMRFVKGVVDSEDLPLAISREKTQDSTLIAKLRKTLVRKFIAHLTTMKKKEPEKFLDEFYFEYSYFLKEGICQDFEFQPQLAKLLHFNTSKTSQSKLVSLDEYVATMRPEQKDIYYLVAPSRAAAFQSPYLEAFSNANIEVLFLYTSIEDFVMANLTQYEGRKFVSVEKNDIDLSPFLTDDGKATKDDGLTEEDKLKHDLYKTDRILSAAECIEFCEWFRATLGPQKVASCTVSTTRLTTFPAMVTDTESGAVRRMLRLLDTTNRAGSGMNTDGSGSDQGVPIPKQHVLINSKHPIITGIHDIMKLEPALARVLVEQVYDNCLVAAGLLDDGRSMLPRLNDILVCVVRGAKYKTEHEGVTTTTTAIESTKEVIDDVLVLENDKNKNDINISSSNATGTTTSSNVIEEAIIVEK